jgi:hypothetical protein
MADHSKALVRYLLLRRRRHNSAAQSRDAKGLRHPDFTEADEHEFRTLEVEINRVRGVAVLDLLFQNRSMTHHLL